ncbi:uncharacterized protein LOC111131248 isoform X11 [Crassostrea virginica]
MAVDILRERQPSVNFGVTRDGRVFFIDDKTRTTSWLHPLKRNPVKTGHRSVAGLPDGWEQAVTPEGAIYFIDHNTQTTTFEHPVAGRTAQHGSPIQGSPTSAASPPNSPGHKVPKSPVRSPTKLRALKAPAAKREETAMVTIRGWLYRQEGSSLKTWKKRWCVLADFGLYFYKDDKEHHSVSSILLPSYQISACHPHSGETNKRFAFKAEHNNMKTCFFASDNQVDMERWINALKLAAALKGVPKRSPEPNNNTPKLIPKSAFMEWDEDEDEDVKKRFSLPPDFPPLKKPHQQSAFGPYQGEGQPQFSPKDNRNQSSGRREPSPKRYEQFPTDPRAQPVEHRPHHRHPDRARPLSEEIPPSRSYQKDNSLRHDNSQNRRLHHDPGSRERPYDDRDPRNLDPRTRTWDNHPPRYADEVDGRVGSSGRIPDYSRAAYDREPERPDSHSQDNVYSKPVKKLNRDLSPHERFEERGGHNRTKEYRVQAQRSPSAKAEDNPYVQMAQYDPRSVERPDIIPHSNHSRETSETSNYGYYSPQRAEAQLDRNYGRDERGYPQDPQILRHGRIRPEHDENYPGRPPNQQPKEPPRLYLTEEQPSAAQPNGPSQQLNRENLSLPVSQNNLYVDIPHTYVNIGDTMTQRGDEQVSPAPNRPPLPTAVRSQYVEELAQAKTPKTSRELLDAERALELRMQQPAYFNYPTPTNEAMPQFPRGGDNYHGNHLHPGYGGNPLQNGERNQNGYKSNAGGRKGRKPQPGMIHTVKEDPNMPDSQVIESSGIPVTTKKYPFGGSRIRMSISAGDLIGKTHDELVLMLIPLRREQAAEENVRNFLRQRLEERKPAEQRYRHMLRQTGGGPVNMSLEEDHNEYIRLKHQLEEVENRLEVYRPLVSLVHNMVNMGSLYGGDNYMMASQYRKHLLSPEEYTPPKKMIEFSRKHQEEEMVQTLKEEIQQLTTDEADLEEKLEKLYELDRKLQEQSFRVTSLQEDKDMLEMALQGILRQQDMSRDNPRDLDNFLKQQRTLEKELSRVMHYLAEASKLLEETTAENNKVEHEVALLRSKVHGELNRSKSAPSLSEENYKNKVKMEKDLAKVQDMMAGLTEQQAELSEAMKRFRRLSSGGGLENMLDKPEKESPKSDKHRAIEKLPSTYMETDLDTGASKDLSQVQQVLHSYNSLPRGGYSLEAAEDNGARFETLVSQNNVSLESSSLSPGGVPVENSDGQWDISEADENTKRFFGIIPKEKPKVLTVRDVKRQSEQRKENHKTRREDISPDPSWNYKVAPNGQVTEPAVASSTNNHPVYENLPPVNASKPWSSVLLSNPSSAPSSRRSSSLHLMGPRPYVPFHLQSNTPSPVTHVESPVTVSTVSSSFHQPSMDGVVKATRIIVQPPFNDEECGTTRAAPVSSHSSMGMFNVKRTPRGRYMTISSSEPVKLETSLITPTSPNTAAGDLITNRMDMVPDIVKSSQKMSNPIDDQAIEREILYVPNKVEIPERYIPDSDDESITEEEKAKRAEKAEKIKRLLANSSVQHSLSQPDVSQVGEIHQQAKEQKIKRAHLLAVGQELAKQVTLKSRQAAAERAKRRKTWSGSPSKVADPVLDADDLEVDRTMGSTEYLAPHHRRQENMYI